MSFTATTASLQKRTEEAIRYVLDWNIGQAGAVYANVTDSTSVVFSRTSDRVVVVGDSVYIGSYLRVVETVTQITFINPKRYSITFTGAITVVQGESVRFDYSENVRRSDDMRSRESIPWLCFVQVINLKQDDPGSTYYTGNLVVSLHSLFNTIAADDGDSVTDSSLITDLAPHEAKVTTITGILSDPVTLWDLVKPGATNRPISDLGIVAILNAEEPGSVSADGMHNFEIRKTIRLINSD